MPRRRRTRNDWDGAEAVYSLVLLGMFLAFFVPGVRQAILSLGGVLLTLLALVALVGIGLLIYQIIDGRRRRADQSFRVKAFNLNTIEPEVIVSPPPPQRSRNSPPEDDCRYAPPPHWPAPESPSAPKPSLVTTKDILARLRAIDWYQFEKIVAITYRKTGYSVAAKGGANPDGGIDLLITKDNIATAVQCKQWRTWNVGVKSIREFLGALTDARIEKGIFVTLQGYTGDAKALADKHGIEILNEDKLAGMLEATGARFDPETLELLEDKRKFCPKCGREMVMKTATKGKNIGKDFWACPGFPHHCNYILRA